MQKIIVFAFTISTILSISVIDGSPVNYGNDANVQDLNTSETLWEIFNQGSRGYSGWGTGVQPQNANYGAWYPGVYGNNYAYGGSQQQQYQQKYPAYLSYSSGLPSYENYGHHGGHGFGKYGKY